VTARSNLIERGEIGYSTQMSYAARPDDRRSNVVDQLILNDVLAVPDRVEHFANGERCGCVLANQLERFLILGRRQIFEPE
jgi:hypothetical protein